MTTRLETRAQHKTMEDETPVKELQKGWLRDLVKEGIESNPGPGPPTWRDLMNKFKTKIEEDELADYDEQLSLLKKEIEKITKPILSSAVRTYLEDSSHAKRIAEIGITTPLVQILVGCCDELEPTTQSENSTVAKKRLREDQDSFYYPFQRQKVFNLSWLQDFTTVLAYTETNITLHIFGAKEFIPKLQQWVEQIQNPKSIIQKKSLLFIDGTVKSGKTLFAKYIALEVRS